jgi:hypothetical protein
MGPDVLAAIAGESGSLRAVHLLGGPRVVAPGVEEQVGSVVGVRGDVEFDSFTPGSPYPLGDSLAHLADAVRAGRAAAQVIGATSGE